MIFSLTLYDLALNHEVLDSLNKTLLRPHISERPRILYRIFCRTAVRVDLSCASDRGLINHSDGH